MITTNTIITYIILSMHTATCLLQIHSTTLQANNEMK